MITKEDLKKYANLLMFDMSDDEYQTLQEEFTIILKQMDLIAKIDGISEVEPMYFPYIPSTNNYRDDDNIAVLTTAEVLENAPLKENNQIKVPKVVE
ncbi:MAG TPA: Asp-tRNA(Asn)/Glu-tRNA(Gln) amidotransferase subunit GatC [Bacilli bacterium]|nr:Asp-tRNA(Asn)/Glu-tRNA(Gln) amidotransferase subunit GatC [Bacilli bacterium]